MRRRQVSKANPGVCTPRDQWTWRDTRGTMRYIDYRHGWISTAERTRPSTTRRRRGIAWFASPGRRVRRLPGQFDLPAPIGLGLLTDDELLWLLRATRPPIILSTVCPPCGTPARRRGAVIDNSCLSTPPAPIPPRHRAQPADDPHSARRVPQRAGRFTPYEPGCRPPGRCRLGGGLHRAAHHLGPAIWVRISGVDRATGSARLVRASGSSPRPWLTGPAGHEGERAAMKKLRRVPYPR